MLKLGFLSITGCSFWNIFFPPRGGLGPKGCVGRTLMNLTITKLQFTICDGKYCMGDDWCNNHVIKKDYNFHFYQSFVTNILDKIFSSMIRARAETCQMLNFNFVYVQI